MFSDSDIEDLLLITAGAIAVSETQQKEKNKIQKNVGSSLGAAP